MPSPANHDLIDIAGELRHETEHAYQFFDGERTVWLPKSECEWDPLDKVMTIPEWIAEEMGLI